MSVPPAPDAEAALQIFQNTLNVSGWMLAGAALIALGVYVALLCSEILADNFPRSAASHRRAGSVAIEEARATEVPLSPPPKDEKIVEMPAAPQAQLPPRVRKRAQRG